MVEVQVGLLWVRFKSEVAAINYDNTKHCPLLSQHGNLLGGKAFFGMFQFL